MLIIIIIITTTKMPPHTLDVMITLQTLNICGSVGVKVKIQVSIKKNFTHIYTYIRLK